MSLLDASVLNCLFQPRYMSMGLCVRLEPTSQKQGRPILLSDQASGCERAYGTREKCQLAVKSLSPLSESDNRE